jgi:membrane associated rhomboid family serine protease
VIDPSTSIGASTADFGILFGLLGMLLVNWFEFKGQQLEQVRCMLIFIVIIMIIFNIMAAGATSDTLGHAGGAIAGFFWGLAVLPRVMSPFTRKL